MRSRADGRRWPELAISRIRCNSSSELCSTSNAAASAVDVPASIAARNDSTSWLRSPMARMPAMRAPPLSVCSSRLSSVTCAWSARSARQRPNAASDCSSSSVASSPKIAAMSASKSSPKPGSSSSGTGRLTGGAGGSRAGATGAEVAKPRGQRFVRSRVVDVRLRTNAALRRSFAAAPGSVSSSADIAAASSMITDRSGAAGMPGCQDCASVRSAASASCASSASSCRSSATQPAVRRDCSGKKPVFSSTCSDTVSSNRTVSCSNSSASLLMPWPLSKSLRT